MSGCQHRIAQRGGLSRLNGAGLQTPHQPRQEAVARVRFINATSKRTRSRAAHSATAPFFISFHYIALKSFTGHVEISPRTV